MRDGIQDAVARAGGIARVERLRNAGFSERALDREIAAGEVKRVRRGWVAIPGADPMAVEAARAGVVISCISQARRLGLWVLEEPAVHVAARPHAGRAPTARAVVHWAKPVVPRHPDLLADPIENVLVLTARCQPREAALAIWESALRKRLIDREAIARLPLPASARDVLDAAQPWADSGLESFALPRLRWLGLPLVRQIWIAGHRVDLLIGERLALQIDGGHHVGAQREQDIAHDAELMLMGYHVVRVGYHQMVDAWPTVQDVIMRAVAAGLHRRR